MGVSGLAESRWSRYPTTMHQPTDGHEIAVGFALRPGNADAVVVVQPRPLKVTTDAPTFPLMSVVLTAAHAVLDTHDTDNGSVSTRRNATRPQRDPFHATASPGESAKAPGPMAMQNLIEGQETLPIEAGFLGWPPSLRSWSLQLCPFHQPARLLKSLPLPTSAQASGAAHDTPRKLVVNDASW